MQFNLNYFVNLHKILNIKVEIMAKSTQRTVIHLEITDNDRTVHKYYGSVSSMYDQFNEEQLGINANYLNKLFFDHKDDENYEFANDNCVIRKGELYTKPTTRGRKPQQTSKIKIDTIDSKDFSTVQELVNDLNRLQKISYIRYETYKRGRGGKSIPCIVKYTKSENMLIAYRYKVKGHTEEEVIDLVIELTKQFIAMDAEEYNALKEIVENLKRQK